MDYITLRNNNRTIKIPKVRKAYSWHRPDFLSKLRIPRKRGGNRKNENSKIKQDDLPKVNTTPNKENEESQENLNLEQMFMIEDKVRQILKEISSLNPLDSRITCCNLFKRSRLEAEIKLKDEKKVIRVKPMIYTSQDKIEFNKQIMELLELDLIRPSKSPHSSPAFLVENHAEKKRNKKRMVINYKALNKETIDDGYYLPKKDELIKLISGKQWYSSFDCKSGFWQVPLKESCKKLTAFSCPSGQFEWNVLPFGLKQAPGIFQRKMDDALELKNITDKSKQFVSLYVDDIIVYSNTRQEHDNHLLQTLLRCKKNGIVLSTKKTQLYLNKINFLGLEITEGTHKLQPHILINLHKFPEKICDKKQLQRFLGCLTYAECYIAKLAEIRKPLQKKLKKDYVWQWTQEDTAYIRKIKNKLKDFPTLYQPQDEDLMILETDASQEYWSGVLKAKSLKNDNQEMLCRYTSGTFTGAELNYHSNEKEWLAVKKAIGKFRIYYLRSLLSERIINNLDLL